MVEEVIISISLIIVLAAVLTIIARIIRQPPILAYLFAGVLAGPLFLGYLSADNSGIIQLMSRIGVAFLLFIVGLSLDYRLFKEIGKVSILAGITEVFAVSILGFLLALKLGFTNLTSIYLGAALAFSSTVVVVKILSDKKHLETLYGKIALGILIVQDIFASIFLMAIPLFGAIGDKTIIFQQLFLALAIVIIVFLLGGFAFNKFLNYLAASQEAMFLFGIAWALVLATAFYSLGFSMEIGALIAGMSLASTKYALDLGGKIKPLRDFFIVIFFVFFGSQLTQFSMSLLITALIFSIFVLLIKPLIVMITLALFGYTKKINFMTSISLAQVSEFSLILVLLGFQLGHLNAEIMNLTVLITLITIGISTYSLHYSEFLSRILNLKIFNLVDGKISDNPSISEKNPEVVLFGYHRIGYKILETLKKMKIKFSVIDYNPGVIAALTKKGISCVYGDASNKNLLCDAGIGNAKLVISTIPEEHTNTMIQEFLDEINSKAAFIATAEQPREALRLYGVGVDYVIIPHHLGGDYASFMIQNLRTNKKRYKEIGKQHKNNLLLGKNNSTFSN